MSTPYRSSPWGNNTPDFWETIRQAQAEEKRRRPTDDAFAYQRKPKAKPAAPVSPWAVLGVAPGSTVNVIKAAYRRWVKLTHPDLGGDPEQFIQIQEAYKTIMREYHV
jgi:DnaJ-class molecular chaperone